MGSDFYKILSEYYVEIMYKTKILVRFDDICPTMDFVQFKRATDLLDQYEVKPFIGVIPDCKDPDLDIEKPHEDFWEFVKSLQAKGYKVAMHGYQHVFNSNHRGLVTNRIGSEFAGHPLDVQIEKIRKGKAILTSHGIDTDIFFAPAHSYDENTVKALAANGFKYMSDGKSSKPYLWHEIKLLPDRDSGCPRIRSRKLYTAVFHAHEWVRPDKKYAYKDLQNLLLQHSEKIVTWDEFALMKCGNLTLQQTVEKCYCLYEQHLKPTLVMLKRILMSTRV